MRKIGVLVLLAFALSLGAQTADSQDRFTLASKIMNETRTIAVRLPVSYPNSERRYPVIYLTDGDGHLGHTAATAEFLAREGRMPEAITVAVVNTERQRDLTPTKSATVQGQMGGADRFLDFFEKELIPAIDARYRTTPYRVFGGHSHGGLFALHGLFTRPKLFNGWIAVSPTFGWDDRYLFRRANEFFDKAPKDFAATVVITVGDEGDATRAFEEFKTLIEKRAPKGFDATFIYYPEEDHGSLVMPSHYAALRKVFGPFRFEVAEGADLKQEFARAGEHYAQLSRRLGHEILPPENLVNILGYRLLQADRTADAIAVFQANVKNWPRSANVYDSLGEAYEKNGQRAEARTSYEMAVKIGTETKDANLAIFQQNAERVR